jgi:hypothetical protein
VSPIAVADAATFESDAELAVDLLDYVPGTPQTFTVLTAAQIVGPLPTLVDAPRPGWFVFYQGSPPRALKVAYSPQ